MRSREHLKPQMHHTTKAPKFYIWVRFRSWRKEVESYLWGFKWEWKEVSRLHVIGDNKSCDGCLEGAEVHKLEKKSMIPLLLLPPESSPRRFRFTRFDKLEQHQNFGLLVVLDWVQWWLLGLQCGGWWIWMWVNWGRDVVMGWGGDKGVGGGGLGFFTN